MFNCSLIDFKDINSFNYNYKKSDYIEDYLIDNNIDILFIINYINYSLEVDVDVESSNDNVFYTNIEQNYKIYKGIGLYNICNIILVKKEYIGFKILDKYYSDFIIQPLSIYNYTLNITLVCIDETATTHNNHKPIEKLLKNQNIIMGGLFRKENNKFYQYDKKLILIDNSYYGLVLKKFKSNELSVIKSNLFDNSIISCSCNLEVNTSTLKFYYSKITTLLAISFIFS